ncbi:hypothetical protein HOK51_11455 [Candidatus Woesearchaeota archaeon]|jgi:hypothetical protein|nr:hypothetical protein [Candidatus Woesearchaeota archaeon]MBT6520438.1 hypothetical protein [Candidatus Woesearchaeota archaeon]MBT7367332.1 hypothetical protein [Candidatus Woesearchaeota archaeon]
MKKLTELVKSGCTNLQKDLQGGVESYTKKPYSIQSNNEAGFGALGLMCGIVLMPVCGYVGSYIGEGFGWLVGNCVDFIPYVQDVAPWIAERSGLIDSSELATDLNENLYQTSAGVAGFWGGFWAPLKIACGLGATKDK